MSFKKKYSHEEDLVIVAEVKANPKNLNKAFFLASKKLKSRSKSGIAFRWYQVLKKEYNVFTLSTDTNVSVNVKNELDTTKETPVKLKNILDSIKIEINSLSAVLNESLINSIVNKINQLNNLIG